MERKETKGGRTATISKEEVIKKLRDNMDKIRGFGVRKIGIFGSVARGMATEKSDIDIVVEFENNRGGMKDFIGVIDFLEKLFNRKVDLLTTYGIENIRIKYIKENIKKDIEYV